MKILIDVRSMGVSPSGIGMYINNIILELIKKDGYELVLVTDISESEELVALEELGIQVLKYGVFIQKNFALFSYYKYIQKMINIVQPDLFWEVNNLVPIKIKNPYGKIVVTIHDMFPITMPSCFGWKYRLYFKYGIKRTLGCVDYIIYDSEDAQNDTERLFSKAKKIASFVSYIIIPEVKSEVIADCNYFLYLGNLEKRKGTDILINAYAEYVKQGGQIPLYMAGKMREDSIRQLYEEKSLEISSLKYLGYVTEEQKRKLYAECSCFLFPTKAEGFGMPVIEAMHYKKEVIATDLAVFRELVGNQITYVPNVVDEKEQANLWIEELLRFSSADKKKYDYADIIDQFGSNKIGRKFDTFFKTIGLSDDKVKIK